MKAQLINRKTAKYRWAIPKNVNGKEFLLYCVREFGTNGIKWGTDINHISVGKIFCTNDIEIYTQIQLTWSEDELWEV